MTNEQKPLTLDEVLELAGKVKNWREELTPKFMDGYNHVLVGNAGRYGEISITIQNIRDKRDTWSGHILGDSYVMKVLGRSYKDNSRIKPLYTLVMREIEDKESEQLATNVEYARGLLRRNTKIK